MEDDLVEVAADVDEEEVGRIMTKYDLLAIPVVDEERRLLGIVTLDDALEAVAARRLEAAPAAAVPLSSARGRPRRPRRRSDRLRARRRLHAAPRRRCGAAPRRAAARSRRKRATSPFACTRRNPPPSSTSGWKRLSSRR